jgi:hypothetical protein
MAKVPLSVDRFMIFPFQENELGAFPLSSKKEVPEDRNPREQPFYLLTYLLLDCTLFVVDIHDDEIFFFVDCYFLVQ